MRNLFWAATITIVLVTPAYGGGVHCFCKLGPLSSPVRNFGEIEHWATQNHDGACRDSCNTKADAFMRDANNRTAACNATHGASVVAYFAIGTKAYAAGGTYNCPQSNPTPTPGHVSFPGKSGGKIPIVTVNGVDVDQLSPLPGNAPSGTPFTTFGFRNKLGSHAQKWTHRSSLSRYVLVEELTGMSQAASSTDVEVAFTGQPNNFARGHTWKVTTHYAGPGYSDTSKSFQFQ